MSFTPNLTLLNLFFWTCFGKFDAISKCLSVRIIAVKWAFNLMISFPYGKNLPGVSLFPQFWHRIVLPHLAGAFFNNSTVNIKRFSLFTRDPELSYRVKYDDVSLLTIPRLEAFIFCQVVKWKTVFLFLILIVKKPEKSDTFIFYKDWIVSLSHHLRSLLWHLPLVAASLSLCFSYNHVELWKCVDLFQWSQVSERPHGNLLQRVCWQRLVQSTLPWLYFACCMWTWRSRFYLSCHHTHDAETQPLNLFINCTPPNQQRSISPLNIWQCLMT